MYFKVSRGFSVIQMLALSILFVYNLRSIDLSNLTGKNHDLKYRCESANVFLVIIFSILGILPLTLADIMS